MIMATILGEFRIRSKPKSYFFFHFHFSIFSLCVYYMLCSIYYFNKDLTASSTLFSSKPSKLFLTSLPFSNLAVMLGGTPKDSLIKIGSLFPVEDLRPE